MHNKFYYNKYAIYSVFSAMCRWHGRCAYIEPFINIRTFMIMITSISHHMEEPEIQDNDRPQTDLCSMNTVSVWVRVWALLAFSYANLISF